VKRYRWLIALGILALLAFAVATLPASILAGRLQSLGLKAVDYDGSIWSGGATGLSWRDAPLGDLQWRITPSALLRGRVVGHARLERADGSLDTDFNVDFAGDAVLSATTLACPVEVLGALPIGVPRGWRGRLSGRFEEIALRHGWPTLLRGTLDLDGLTSPPPANANIGAFHLVAPHPKPFREGTLPGHLTAQITDRGDGPYSVDMQLSLAQDHSFLLEGGVAPLTSAPEAMQRAFELLGPPDAAGRRPFSISGTL